MELRVDDSYRVRSTLESKSGEGTIVDDVVEWSFLVKCEEKRLKDVGHVGLLPCS